MTPLQELVCRSGLKAVTRTNYDRGILDVRRPVRRSVSVTGFVTWVDELGPNRWRTGEPCQISDGGMVTRQAWLIDLTCITH